MSAAPRLAAATRLGTFGLGVLLVGVQVHEAVASLGLGLVVLSTLLTPRETLEEALRPRAYWPLYAFFLWAVLAPALKSHWPTGTGVARAIDLCAIPFIAVAARRVSYQAETWLGRIAVAVALVSCVVAGLQHYGVWPPLEKFASLDWTRIPFDRVYEPAPRAPGQFMGGGLLFHRLKFAHVTGLFAATAFALSSEVGAARWLKLLAIPLALAVGAFPLARMATVAVFVAFFVVTTVRSGRKGWVTGVIAVVAFGGLFLMNAPLRDRFVEATSSQGNGERAALWATGVRAVQSEPVVGIGLGRFRPDGFSNETTPAMVKENTGKAHNQLLSMAAETGVVGAALFVFALLSLLRARPSLTSFGALAFFAALGATHDPLIQAPFSMAFAVAMALGQVVTPLPRDTSQASDEHNDPT